MTHRLLVSDTKVIDTEAIREELDASDVRLERTDARMPDDLIDVAAEIDGLVVDANTHVTERVISSLNSLEVVGRAGIGVDNVDVRAAADHGVTVVNVPDYCLDEVSTHALGLMLACVRRIPTFDRAVRDGTWDWTVGRPIDRLQGQTVGLVAFGKIARSLSRKLRGFDVDVLVYDPYVSEPEMAGFDVTKVSFRNLLDRSHVVSVHAPLTNETRGLFDVDAFSSMRENAVLVNTARGGIVDESALHGALVSGEIAAAGLDVREEEPPTATPLSELETVVFTPHVGWYSEASRSELTRSVFVDVLQVLDGGDPDHPVDPESSW
ncbi:C-terminal binding protein [Halalkalicoccus sp. NIPERK01]|uniref:C-terminal binding protein n=1 Tax=Halalkalicoccus sp. NIPERK01 TaxID=3053469 RepID=UPI00256EA8FF|nr:C-terminal binding protein [Halalkalicoccus sp. NIPERK01]MDL5363268.1 C-terminal binding protein [Halalkalicoccus sp. NIPERK01]